MHTTLSASVTMENVVHGHLACLTSPNFLLIYKYLRLKANLATQVGKATRLTPLALISLRMKQTSLSLEVKTLTFTLAVFMLATLSMSRKLYLPIKHLSPRFMSTLVNLSLKEAVIFLT
jgi:hypothetical protein